jgi:hypothetical protein
MCVMFSQAGNASVALIKGAVPRPSKGFAFVKWIPQASAQKAITMFKDYMMNGAAVRKLRPVGERCSGGGFSATRNQKRGERQRRYYDKIINFVSDQLFPGMDWNGDQLAEAM